MRATVNRGAGWLSEDGWARFESLTVEIEALAAIGAVGTAWDAVDVMI